MFLCPFWMNEGLNILSVAPDEVQNKLNYGIERKE